MTLARLPMFRASLQVLACLAALALHSRAQGVDPARDTRGAPRYPSPGKVREFELADSTGTSRDERRALLDSCELVHARSDARGVALEPIGPGVEGAAVLTLPVTDLLVFFDEALVSWNVDAPPGTGFVVELRVRTFWRAPWSPWMCVGEWGDVPAFERATKFDDGGIDVDRFRSTRTCDKVELRVRGFAREGARESVLRVERVSLSLLGPGAGLPGTGMDTRSSHIESFGCLGSTRAVPWVPPVVRVELPEAATAADGRVGTSRRSLPRCLDAVTRYLRPDVVVPLPARDASPAAELTAIDRPTRAVQAAFTRGMRARLAGFADWSLVERELRAQRPVILLVESSASPTAKVEREPLEALLLVGFDAEGKCLVRDATASGGLAVERTRNLADLQERWSAAGGRAIVFDGALADHR